VGDIVDGTAQGQERTAMVGVANLGNADDLTGHQFSQANLFAFGRLAWDWTQRSQSIADDWTRMTWSNDRHVVDTIVQMMMGSREAVVSYQTPLGIAHQMHANTHYAPGPDETLARPDWSPTYYNKADKVGLGYDRSRTGSDFVDQYFPALADRYNDIDTTPENLLMWFHHVPWGYQMKDGLPFWDELVYRYQMGSSTSLGCARLGIRSSRRSTHGGSARCRPSSRSTRWTRKTGVTPASATGRSSAAVRCPPTTAPRRSRL
jgi:alpha-glucuronidase